MTPAAFLMIPLSLVLAQPDPYFQQATARSVVQESIEDKVARLEQVFGELLAIAESDSEDADEAWEGIERVIKLAEQEYRERRRAANKVEVDPAERELWERRKRWVDDINQFDDAARRLAALEEIRAALVSPDANVQKLACDSLRQVSQVEFDKASFRQPVLTIAQNAEGQLRASALYALYSTQREPSDLELALQLANDEDTEARISAGRLIFHYSDGDLTGRSGEAVLKLLHEDHGRLREVLAGLWGAKVSSAIEARLLELSRAKTGELGYDALYYGLSTLEDKSAAVVGRLLEAIEKGDTWRALWGLGHGVPEAQYVQTVVGMRKLFEARVDPSTRADALNLVGKYGDENDIAWLESIRDTPGAQQSVRDAAGRAIQAILE